MAEIDLQILEALVSKCEACPARDECGRVRLTLARELVDTRERPRRLAISELLTRIERLLTAEAGDSHPG